MRILGIIPSRLESSRIKQKPLHKVFGVSLIEHVYRRALLCDILDDVIVATDNESILSLINSIGGKAMLTRKDHRNGTERMSEVVSEFSDFDYYVLINGDEILLNPESIKESIDTLVSNPWADASILAIKYFKKNSKSDFKVVFKKNMELMYISREDIPSNSRNKVDNLLKAYHLMTFKKDTIIDYSKLGISYLESIEDHEHLRLIENDYKIVGKIVDDDCISMDTYEDIEAIEKKLKVDKIYLENIKD